MLVFPKHALAVTQTGDPGAAGLLPQDISVGQALLTAYFFDDLSQPKTCALRQ